MEDFSEQMRPSRYVVRDSKGSCVWEKGIDQDVVNRLRSLEFLPDFNDVIQIRPEYRKYWRIEFGDGELLSQEFVDEIAFSLKNIVNKEDKILEIGAGSGRLSQFLRQRTGFNIVAIDNNRAAIPICFSVKRLDVREAYDLYQPTILIISWPPDDMSWRPIPKSVQKIILFGEASECGGGNIWKAPAGFNILSLHQVEKFQQSVSSFSQSVLIQRIKNRLN